MVFLACTMSKFYLHVVIYFSLIVIAVAMPRANRLNQFCDILSMYESEPKLEQLYDDALPNHGANVVVDAFKQCADLQRTSPIPDKIVYVLMCQEIEIIGKEKCKRNSKFDITYWQTNDEPCSIYHQALQSIPNENFAELKEPPEGKPVPSVVLHYLKNPSINPYTRRSDCSTLCGQSAVEPICDLAALLYVTPVQETSPVDSKYPDTTTSGHTDLAEMQSSSDFESKLVGVVNKIEDQLNMLLSRGNAINETKNDLEVLRTTITNINNEIDSLQKKVGSLNAVVENLKNELSDVHSPNKADGTTNIEGSFPNLQPMGKHFIDVSGGLTEEYHSAKEVKTLSGYNNGRDNQGVPDSSVVQSSFSGAPDGVSPDLGKGSEQVDTNHARSAPTGQEDSNKDAQTMAQEAESQQDKSSPPGIQENTSKKEVVPNTIQSDVAKNSKQSQSIPEPGNERPDKSNLPKSTENNPSKTVEASSKSNGDAHELVAQTLPANNKAPESTPTSNATAKSTTVNSTTKVKEEKKTEPSNSDSTNTKVKDPAGDLTPNIKDAPGAEGKADAALPAKDDKTDGTTLESTEKKQRQNEDNSKPAVTGDDVNKATNNVPATTNQQVTEKNKNNNNEDNAEHVDETEPSKETKPKPADPEQVDETEPSKETKPKVDPQQADETEPSKETKPKADPQQVDETEPSKEAKPKADPQQVDETEPSKEIKPKPADPQQVDETEPSKETKPKPAESENALPKPDINNDDEGAGQDMEKTVGSEDRFPPVEGDKENLQSSDRQPEDLPDRKSLPNSAFPEQEDSHFFAYFLTVIIIIILAYLVVHNKQKILGLIVEGRGTQRRRSHSYRKLDSDASKGSQMIF